MRFRRVSWRPSPISASSPLCHSVVVRRWNETERIVISSEAAGEAQAYFGWKVVAAAFVLALFGWGIGFYGPSVFLRTLNDERGWPIALVSAAITAHFLFSALFTCPKPMRGGASRG